MPDETVRPAFSGRDRPLLSYGLPFPDAAAKHVSETFSASRVYVIISGSLARNTDALDRLGTRLGAGKVVGVRRGMKSHTLWSEVLEIVDDVRRTDADLIVTLGGGSLTDGAKVVAFVCRPLFSPNTPHIYPYCHTSINLTKQLKALANNVHTATDLSSLSQGPQKRPISSIAPPTVPILSIPTSLSAGEYSNFAGSTNDTTRRKHSFQAPLRGPQLVVLDPVLTASTPDAIWLSTGVRAVDHCVETLCAITTSSPSPSTPAGPGSIDELAIQALGKLVPGLLRTKSARDDSGARLACQLGSVDAMAACTGGGVELGASHGIGHQLGPLGVGHGETSCVLLPAVCKFNARYSEANRARQDRVRALLVADPVVDGVLRARTMVIGELDLGDVLDAVIRELGMPRSLREVGVGREQLDGLAENSLHDRWCISNPVPLREKTQVLEILESVVD